MKTGIIMQGLNTGTYFVDLAICANTKAYFSRLCNDNDICGNGLTE